MLGFPTRATDIGLFGGSAVEGAPSIAAPAASYAVDFSLPGFRTPHFVLERAWTPLDAWCVIRSSARNCVEVSRQTRHKLCLRPDPI